MFKQFLISLIRPKTILAKILIASTIVTLIVVLQMGHLDEMIQVLKSEEFTFRLGTYSLNLYLIIKSLILLIVLFWLASIVSDAITDRVKKLSKINSSNRTLINKFIQITLYFFVLLIGLNLIGIDITTLTVLSGAIGIGIGFGLQKIASNFISGLILLFEKSIEEGDLVEFTEGIQGTVISTNSRYTLLETFDGREIFIPNEDFITSKVTNWTFTDNKGRVTINVGVSYDSDLDLVKQILWDSAISHPECSKTNPPHIFLEAFADSSVNFLLVVWIDDVLQGRMKVKSEVMFEIWNQFKKHKIEIPFPQRDINIKNPKGISLNN